MSEQAWCSACSNTGTVYINRSGGPDPDAWEPQDCPECSPCTPEEWEQADARLDAALARGREAFVNTDPTRDGSGIPLMKPDPMENTRGK